MVKTTTQNPNKFFHFFKGKAECPPTYDEAVNDEDQSQEWSSLQDPSQKKDDPELQDPSKNGKVLCSQHQEK